MRATVERVRGWFAAPQVFEVVALASCGLLALLEGRTPWEVTYTLIGDGGFLGVRLFWRDYAASGIA